MHKKINSNISVNIFFNQCCSVTKGKNKINLIFKYSNQGENNNLQEIEFQIIEKVFLFSGKYIYIAYIRYKYFKLKI